MCAIAGIYKTQTNTIDHRLPERISQMTNNQQFRGPDACEICVRDHVAFGLARLIIRDDGVQSRQPHVSSWGAITVFNGEIYNLSELRVRYDLPGSTEVEMLAYILRTEGVEGLKQVKGMYAVAYADVARHSLILARSPFGQKPLYVQQTGEEIVFASSIAGISRGTGKKLQLNPEAIPEYLIYRSIGGYKSAFMDVQTVPPGSWVKFEGNRRTEGLIWQAPDLAEGTLGLAEQIRSSFYRAVERRLEYQGPLAVTVSGGFDSSLVACLSAKRKSNDLRLFCIGYDIEDQADERVYAHQVASFTNTPICDITLRSDDIPALMDESAGLLEDPNQDPVVVPTLALAKRIKEYTNVTLTGDGSDEIWGGYDRFARPIQRIEEYYGHTTIFSPAELGIAELPDSYLAQIQLPDQQLPVIDQVFRYELSNRLLNYHLSRVDKIYAGIAVEPRSPFLDVDFLTLGLSIPGRIKRAGGKAKALLLQAFQDDVPRWLIERKKQPFSLPLAKLFTGPLKAFAFETINDPTGIAHNYIDCKQVLELLDKPSASFSFRDAQKLWSVCFINRWHKHWFEN